ncbi:hypothetical protein I4U23_026239 [Adineta vaga]|nr:hypothetical protein I4U23_026239 [Adineta vaga]
MSMKQSYIGLNELPDEILMIIFEKLSTFDVLYSLQNVNQRLNTIIYDSTFTNHLSFIKWLPNKFIDLLSCHTILDRICQKILPKICDKVKRLDLHSSSMKHVLRAAHYPNIHCLSIYNINEDCIRSLFIDEEFSCGILENQITKLLITFDNDNGEDYHDMLLTFMNIFHYILVTFTSLNCLILHQSSYAGRFLLSIENLPSTFRSSTLLKLDIKLQCFDDCLILLDGRFNQLHTLHIDLVHMRWSNVIQNQDNLPHLKCFSLSSLHATLCYDEIILSLLYRMSNLEQLGLSLVSIDNEMNLLSTEDIQRTFIDFPNNQIISYVDHFLEAKESLCHVYSYPPRMIYYGYISNNFPGGLFKTVRVISLVDEKSFEHEFFFEIQKSFPYLEKLSVINYKPQLRKQSYRSKNNRIIYSFLYQLSIINVHDNYIEQFLFDSNTSLLNNFTLYIKYESLQRVTHNFTRDITRNNCTKINKLYLCGKSEPSNILQEYFPCAEIDYSSIFG